MRIEDVEELTEFALRDYKEKASNKGQIPIEVGITSKLWTMMKKEYDESSV